MNLEKRLWEHENLVGATYTKTRLPVKLVYFQEFTRIDEAFLHEKQVQGWSHAKKKALIEQDWNRVQGLAKSIKGRIDRASISSADG